MASHTRILNETRRFWLKMSQVERGIGSGAYAWVKKGETVRDMTLAEQIQFRKEQAKVREPLAYAEVPGLTYEPSASGVTATRESYGLVRAAHEFCMEAA